MSAKRQAKGGLGVNSTFAKERKPIKQVNLERQAKRRSRYSAKLAAYRRSETYRAVEFRANGQCEAVVNIVHDAHRCKAKRARGYTLVHHHKTYARFGGAELPEDVIVLCQSHNEEAESKHTTRNRNYRRAS